MKPLTAKDVSFLRQWLNESRITDPKKLVTNEELLSALNAGRKLEAGAKDFAKRFQSVMKELADK